MNKRIKGIKKIAILCVLALLGRIALAAFENELPVKRMPAPKPQAKPEQVQSPVPVPVPVPRPVTASAPAVTKQEAENKKNDCLTLLRDQFSTRANIKSSTVWLAAGESEAQELRNRINSIIGARTDYNSHEISSADKYANISGFRYGCVGYRTDIRGNAAGAECLALLLGPEYKAVNDTCYSSGFSYNIVPSKADVK